MKPVLPEGLTILLKHWEEMLADVRGRAPEEACGLVAGMDGLTSRVYPITNQFHSRTRFRMDPGEQLQGLIAIEESGNQLLAIYHSHPAGPDRPSLTDVAEAAYPGVIHLIWHLQAGSWVCSGFLIEEQRVIPVTLLVTPEPVDR